MKAMGSPDVKGVSVMRREVTGRWRDGSGKSRNWSAHFVGGDAGLVTFSFVYVSNLGCGRRV